VHCIFLFISPGERIRLTSTFGDGGCTKAPLHVSLHSSQDMLILCETTYAKCFYEGGSSLNTYGVLMRHRPPVKELSIRAPAHNHIFCLHLRQ
jgi:hypothetical protein